MKTETAPSDLERRKKVRLRVRGDLSIAPQRYEGRTYYVIKDPVSLRYYRFKEQEHFLIELMDGTHTLDDSQKEFEKRFRPDRLTLEDLEQFGQQLLTAGLVQNESPQAGKQLFDRRTKRRRSEWMQTLTNILYIKLPIFDPDRLLTWMINHLCPGALRFEAALFYLLTMAVVLGSALFAASYAELLPAWAPAALAWVGPALGLWAGWGVIRLLFKVLGFLTVSVGVMLAAILLVATHFQTFQEKLPSYQEFFNVKTVMYLWIALGIVKVIHEFGHGLSCRWFGGEVHEMGFLLLCFSPAMYCNVSDAWTLPSKWRRIIISGAGIYVELMIAAIATFLWWNTPGLPFVNYMSLSLMVVCSVSTVLFNGNPLMRYDGYYVLADWLEIPNLRDRANRYLQRLVMEHCLGIEVQPEPYMALWRRVLFVTYAVISWVYRWVVTFFVLRFMATFLRPYKLEVISSMLAATALGSMVGWPLWRLGKNLHKRGRLPDMKPVPTAVSAAVLAVVLLAFFLVPLPVTRVSQSGLIQLQPSTQEPVRIEVAGILEKINVKEGQAVKQGAILAKFSNLELQMQEASAKSDLEIKEQVLDAFQALRAGARDDAEIRKLHVLESRAAGDRDLARAKYFQISEEVRRKLTLVAPIDGVVMGVPLPEEVGKRWEKDQPTPFCTVGDPRQLRVLVPVLPDDYNLILGDKDRKQKRQEELAVTIRVQGRGGDTWQGRVTHMPQSEAREVPISLTNKGGGPLAIKPGGDPNHLIPQNQVFLVGIDFADPDIAVCPGQLAQVKIHCEYRSCAWWVWHSINKTFDLGLL